MTCASFVRLAFATASIALVCVEGLASAQARGSSKPVQKRFAFAMEDKTWRAVFEWLVDTSGSPYVSSVRPPAGRFTFVPRSGEPGYTLDEIIQTVNDGLAPMKYALIR